MKIKRQFKTNEHTVDTYVYYTWGRNKKSSQLAYVSIQRI